MRFSPILALFVLLAAPALAQQVAFGGLKADAKAPVEVTADSLNINQADGTAVFSGNVLVVQGGMRMQAAAIRVGYALDDRTKIQTMTATGGVTLVSPTEAAEFEGGGL
ncbi:LptA/OstA family protein [Paenirhodobacter sp.]|uniref:LptA/OstA family protein n=1 Tax=Paenirhodobacter sp. TaxID=1965326 RepID=UPI003B50E20E